MVKKYLFVAAFALAATPALADFSVCSEPYGPAIPNGATVTEDQLKRTLSDVKQFIKDSDDYQVCIGNEYKRQDDEARHSKDKKPLDPSIKVEADGLIARNQQQKQKVGDEFNAAAKAFNDAHPSAPPKSP